MVIFGPRGCVFDWLRKVKHSVRPRRASNPPLDRLLFDQSGERLYKALADFWSSSDPKSYSPSGASVQVKALEERYALSLPEDFRSYLLNAAPRTTYMDGNGTQWWAPSEIKSIADECPDGSPGKTNHDIEQ